MHTEHTAAQTGPAPGLRLLEGRPSKAFLQEPVSGFHSTEFPEEEDKLDDSSHKHNRKKSCTCLIPWQEGGGVGEGAGV